MKKTLSVLLAVLMLLTLTVSAFAEPLIEDDGNGSDSHNVTAGFKGATTDSAGNVYYVTVAWTPGENTLSYFEGNTTYTWNGASMQYQAGALEDEGWTGSAAVKVTVTNQSNAEVNAQASWKDAQGITAECKFDKDTAKLDSAAEGIDYNNTQATGSPKTADINATVEVKSGTIQDNGATVGTITVTISPVQ